MCLCDLSLLYKKLIIYFIFLFKVISNTTEDALAPRDSIAQTPQSSFCGYSTRCLTA